MLIEITLLILWGLKFLSVSIIILAINNKEKTNYNFFWMEKGDQEKKTG